MEVTSRFSLNTSCQCFYIRPLSPGTTDLMMAQVVFPQAQNNCWKLSLSPTDPSEHFRHKDTAMPRIHPLCLLFLVSDEVAKENKRKKKISQSEKHSFKTVNRIRSERFWGRLAAGQMMPGEPSSLPALKICSYKILSKIHQSQP